MVFKDSGFMVTKAEDFWNIRKLFKPFSCSVDKGIQVFTILVFWPDLAFIGSLIVFTLHGAEEITEVKPYSASFPACKQVPAHHVPVAVWVIPVTIRGKEVVE